MNCDPLEIPYRNIASHEHYMPQKLQSDNGEPDMYFYLRELNLEEQQVVQSCSHVEWILCFLRTGSHSQGFKINPLNPENP